MWLTKYRIRSIPLFYELENTAIGMLKNNCSGSPTS
jgi:hypothetical protein